MKRLIIGLAVLVMVLSLCLPGSAETISLADDFDDGILDPAWQVLTQNGGASWSESAGTLNVGGSSGQTGELVMRYNQALGNVGSVRIDYNWTAYSGHKARVGLGLLESSLVSFQNEPKSGVWLKCVRYRSTGLHAIDGAAPDGVYHIEYSVPTSGSLMIERNGNDFQIKYIDGGVWQNLFQTQYDFGNTPLFPYIFTSNSDTNPSWQVALDNFSGEFTTVPEPTALVMLFVGAFWGVACWRRRSY